ncbi:MAG TPA: hypothetical protein DCS07_01250 [Bdellovibrionales bacterium]|nr:MAG: hypothetical protein A2Z97_01590 [Bdellovibrionales bacterium GWB1_52_6]OFZ05032.1 MAG: hypothetical protein A2X97_00350 [Bdellovibrionales bacterium GWA1_52_35]OFZ43263.1 MAG: hypothetical protein A2070_12825 [Bdellovibrionales bacterium GWC1_52_8]HAR41253.1 hypothetical protein [Bdellovibrionales bacterium]HCM41265.1 hypothetical protein [Bdellovibrionales bacterium]
MKEIYLGRLGKAFGPYTEQEFQGLENSGELKNFTWLWNAGANCWEALDPAPVPLVLKPKTEHAGTSPQIFKHDSLLPLDVICHNGIHALTGSIRNAINEGCEFVAHSNTTESPFPVPSRIVLSLLDPRAGKSLDISARLLKLARKDGRWTYTLSWENIPELVLDSITN